MVAGLEEQVKWFTQLAKTLCITGIPCFPKVRVTSLCFYERPVPVFSNGKKSEEDFHFYEKKGKAKIAFRVCSLASCIEAARTRSNFPRNYT